MGEQQDRRCSHPVQYKRFQGAALHELLCCLQKPASDFTFNMTAQPHSPPKRLLVFMEGFSVWAESGAHAPRRYVMFPSYSGLSKPYIGISKTMELYITLYSLTLPYTAFHNPTHPYIALHNLTQPYTTVHSPTQLYMALHNFTQPYTAIHSSTQPYTAMAESADQNDCRGAKTKRRERTLVFDLRLQSLSSRHRYAFSPFSSAFGHFARRILPTPKTLAIYSSGSF